MIPRFDVRRALAEQPKVLLETLGDDLEERAAIIAEGCCIDQDQAAEMAAAEAEPSRIEIFANRIERWLDALDVLTGMLDGKEQTLLAASKKFALSVWAHPAVAAGWSDGELFGLPAGLVPQMALRHLHLMAIDENGATLMSGRGIVAQYERARFRNGHGRPWWHQ